MSRGGFARTIHEIVMQFSSFGVVAQGYETSGNAGALRVDSSCGTDGDGDDRRRKWHLASSPGGQGAFLSLQRLFNLFASRRLAAAASLSHRFREGRRGSDGALDAGRVWRGFFGLWLVGDPGGIDQLGGGGVPPATERGAKKNPREAGASFSFTTKDLMLVAHPAARVNNPLPRIRPDDCGGGSVLLDEGQIGSDLPGRMKIAGTVPGGPAAHCA